MHPLHPLHPLDLTIIFAYLVLITFVGLRLAGRVKSAHDFFLAGRTLSWWVIGLSIIGTNIGANSYVGAAGNAFSIGIAQANFEWIGAIPAMILAALVFIPLYWNTLLLRCLKPHRYNRKVFIERVNRARHFKDKCKVVLAHYGLLPWHQLRNELHINATNLRLETQREQQHLAI